MQNELQMQYRRGAGDDMISVLGYGCMRFSRRAGAIDMDKAQKELMAAIGHLQKAIVYIQGNVSVAAACGYLEWALR